MELIRRSVWVYWTTATSLTSSPGPQNGSLSCFEREGLHFWANLYCSDRFENAAATLKWRERGLFSMHLPTGETNANHLLSYTDMLFSIWQGRNQWTMLVSAIPDRMTITLFFSFSSQTTELEGLKGANQKQILTTICLTKTKEALLDFFPFSFILSLGFSLHTNQNIAFPVVIYVISKWKTYTIHS